MFLQKKILFPNEVLQKQNDKPSFGGETIFFRNESII